MKNKSKKNLAQVAQKLDKDQVIDQSMKTAIKGGDIVIQDVIM